MQVVSGRLSSIEEARVLTVRPTDASDSEIDLIARRMRATLQEVLDDETGREMYSLAWLRDRVRQHLDPDDLQGAVYVCLDDDGTTVVGHTIVREEEDVDLGRYGLFSTTYVEPSARRLGVAKLLLDAGERWMRGRGLTTAATFTDPDNTKLIELYRARGYALDPAGPEFVRLHRKL